MRKSLIIFPPPYIVKKKKLHFRKCLKTVLNKFEGEDFKNDPHFSKFTVFMDFLHFYTIFKTCKVCTPNSTLKIYFFAIYIITKFKVLK